MKQNLPPARSVLLDALIASSLTLCLSACATLPRKASSNSEKALNTAKLQPQPTLNINLASANELENLPGIGKVMAERIIAYRSAYGPFRRPEHLMMVRGISDRKFREMRPLIVVE